MSDEQWGLSLELPDLAGFRLWNVELLNWGTFDGSIVSFPIEGQYAFVTGSVGAGKSTVVDALTTLFVPTARIVYNKAAGAGKNERRLETYLRGVYSTAADDTGTRAKPVALRDTRHVSAILAHFRDEQANADAVFVHVYYFTAAGSIEKIYAVSDAPITLEALLAGANSDPRTLQKLIRQRMERCDSWRDYLLAVRRKLGLPHEQALDLWFQTVSMKQVENLTAFVRSHMLEPPDETREKIDDLVAHYEDLTASAAAIDRAKAQLAILDPLIENFDDYDRHAGDGDGLARVRDQALEQVLPGHRDRSGGCGHRGGGRPNEVRAGAEGGAGSAEEGDRGPDRRPRQDDQRLRRCRADRAGEADRVGRGRPGVAAIPPDAVRGQVPGRRSRAGLRSGARSS